MKLKQVDDKWIIEFPNGDTITLDREDLAINLMEIIERHLQDKIEMAIIEHEEN